MKKLIILALVAMIALTAAPAFASVQNVKVSGSIDNMYLWRDNFDLGTNIIGDETQSLFITFTTLQVDADLTDQVSTTVGLINERAWEQNADSGAGDPTSNGVDNTDIDIYLAYVTLREMLYSPLTVVIGRQVFSYGNSLVMDATGPNNSAGADSGLAAVAGDLTKQTSLDAFRFIFDYNPLTMELMYSKVAANTLLAAADDDDDIDLYGINTTYELGDDMNSVIEAYFFARIDQIENVTGLAGDHFSKADTTYVPGLRASADVLDGLNVQGEVAWQRGNRVATTSTIRDNEQREAMAAQFIGNYQIPNDVLPDALEEYNPVVQYVYTYVSGDSNPNDRQTTPDSGGESGETFTAWDPFFENQGGGTIYNSLFNLSNLHIHSVSLTANPMEDVTTKVSWHGLWLDKKLNNGNGTTTGPGNLFLNQPDGGNIGATAIDLSTSDDELGYEVDFEAIYDYTEDVQFGALLGWFVPGDVFLGDTNATATNNGNGNDKIASQAIIHGNVNF